MIDPGSAPSLPGPAALDARRQRARDQLGGSIELPTTEEEAWRYSRVDELDLAAFTVAEPSTTGVPDEVAGLLASLPAIAGAVVVRNGIVVHAEVADRWRAQGVVAGPVGETDVEAVGSVMREPVDVFARLNDAFTAVPVVVSVPRGVVVDEPVVVVDWVDDDGTATFPRTVVQAGTDAQCDVLEWHGSAEGTASLVAPIVEIDVADAARVRHVLVQDRGPNVWQFLNMAVSVGQDAHFVSGHAALGGDYARSRTDCRLDGRGASGDLFAVYFGERNQMLDFRTFQHHIAPDTSSNLLFKGAVADQSRSVYTGLIHVGKHARGTNAFQTNRNIKLGDGAWAESVPNLEIENNDVRCSHASTVGPIDEDQRFYLESRGVPPDVAEQLIVAGFFDEVLRLLPVGGVGDLLELEIDRRLAGKGR